MNREDLVSYKKKIAELDEKEKKLRDLELRKYASGELQGPLVGYPSIDKPWLGKYPEFLFNIKNQNNKILSTINSVWNDDEIIINYYGTDITKKEFNDRIGDVIKSLDEAGIRKGDSIMTSLESVPEFLELFFACEYIGCSIKNYIGAVDEVIDLINEDKSIKLYVCPNYMNKCDLDRINNETKVNNIVTVSPLNSTLRSRVRKNILEELYARYSEDSVCNCDSYLDWNEFINKGKDNKNIIPENMDTNIKLYSAFTSGTTGKSKEVEHSSETILGIINQMVMFPNRGQEERASWLLTILPPTLVAVVVAMICHPLADGKTMILDPYCNINDIDLEMMHYEPESWGMIPLFFSVLLDSKRIPDDYDMSYFKLFGFGAEYVTADFVNRVQKFIDKHNCKAPISSGYGQSEGGSDFTIAMGKDMITVGAAGMPLIDTNIAIFEPKTSNELSYNEIGEVCKSGPGLMLGYSDKELTKEVIKVHDDGTTWLHTGDYGYVDNNGILYVLGRESIKLYPNKEFYPLTLENKISVFPGIKDVIVVSGEDREHIGFNTITLFIVLNDDIEIDIFREELDKYLENNLSEVEFKNIYFIDKKPISKFKTDRKTLKKNYNIR